MRSQNGKNKFQAQIGDAMMVTFDRTDEPIKAVFTGMETGAFFILRLPPGAGVSDHLFEGNGAVIKYVSEGTVYGFRAEVAAYLYKKRLILVVFSFPRTVETHELRKEPRIGFLVPAELELADRRVNGFVVDISPGGCRFTTTLPPGDLPVDLQVVKEVALHFALVGLEGRQVINCEIKNVAQRQNGLSLGLQFSQPEDRITEGIRDYIVQVSGFKQ
jgi:hypothetical protein